MPAFGAPVHAVYPGERFTLFDGTETVADEFASVAFALGYSVGGASGPMTFFAKGMASDMVISAQAANGTPAGAEPAEADYATIDTIVADANGDGYYTDAGNSGWYRVKITVYTTGTMPIVTVKR